MPLVFQVLCALFSGILTALALPNEFFYMGLPPLGFLALVPLYAAAKEARSYKNAALLFGIDALSAHLFSSYWLANFKDFAIFTLGASAAGTACIEALAGCLYFFPFAGGGRFLAAGAVLRLPKIGKNGQKTIFFEPYRAVHFACVRAVYEWAKSTGFLAYPWGVLSMAAFSDKILLQCADTFGTYGISFFMALFSAAASETSLFLAKNGASRFFKKGADGLFGLAAGTALSLALLFCYGTFRLRQESPAAKTLNAVLVQQNMDPWASDDDEESARRSMALTERGIEEFEKKGKKAALVVWSEAVLRYPLPAAAGRYQFIPKEESLMDFIRRTGVPFVIGGPYSGKTDAKEIYNAALVFDKNGVLGGWYGKTHLVPFAEVIPGAEHEWVRKTMDGLVGFSNGWTPGGRLVLFSFDAEEREDKKSPLIRSFAGGQAAQGRETVLAAIPICFEDAFPDVCGPFHKAGAEVFLNITDDSWSKTKSAEWQHLAAAAFRAVEYRTSLVRSTNAGVTVVVDDKGRILERLPLFEEGHLCAEIPIFQRRETVYSLFGNWLVRLIWLFFAALFILKAREARPPSLKELVRREVEKALCGL